ALVLRLRARDASRDDLAVLVHEVLEDGDIFVVHPLDVFSGKSAELPAPEQPAILRFLAVLAELAFAFTFAAGCGSGHDSLRIDDLEFVDMKDRDIAAGTALGEETLHRDALALAESAEPGGNVAEPRSVDRDLDCPCSTRLDLLRDVPQPQGHGVDSARRSPYRAHVEDLGVEEELVAIHPFRFGRYAAAAGCSRAG